MTEQPKDPTTITEVAGNKETNARKIQDAMVEAERMDLAEDDVEIDRDLGKLRAILNKGTATRTMPTGTTKYQGRGGSSGEQHRRILQRYNKNIASTETLSLGKSNTVGTAALFLQRLRRKLEEEEEDEEIDMDMEVQVDHGATAKPPIKDPATRGAHTDALLTPWAHTMGSGVSTSTAALSSIRSPLETTLSMGLNGLSRVSPVLNGTPGQPQAHPASNAVGSVRPPTSMGLNEVPRVPSVLSGTSGQGPLRRAQSTGHGAVSVRPPTPLALNVGPRLTSVLNGTLGQAQMRQVQSSGNCAVSSDLPPKPMGLNGLPRVTSVLSGTSGRVPMRQAPSTGNGVSTAISLPNATPNMPDNSIFNQVISAHNKCQVLLSQRLRDIDLSRKAYDEDRKMYVTRIRTSKRNSAKLGQMEEKRDPVLVPFFADSNGNGPPQTDDMRKFHQVEAILPSSVSMPKWPESNKTRLVKIVQMDAQMSEFGCLLQTFRQRQAHMEAIRARTMSENDARDLLNAYEKDVSLLMNLCDPDRPIDPNNVSWSRVATAMPIIRSANECRIQWSAISNPKLNKSTWTVEENERLRALVTQFNERHWETVAEKLGTGRTAAQCIIQYRQKLNRHMTGKWTKKEDAVLTASVRIHGEGDWLLISSYLGKRTPQQCLYRWLKTLHPSIKRGKWTKHEDKLLRDAVDLHGSKGWSIVQKHVPNRTDVQCRERYVNALDPMIDKSCPFTDEENEKIMKHVEEFGECKWAQIANDLITRTDSQVARQYRKLLRAKVKGNSLEARDSMGPYMEEEMDTDTQF